MTFSHAYVLSIAGKANLEKADLEPALKALKDRLMTKNVVCFLLSASSSIINSVSVVHTSCINSDLKSTLNLT